MDVAASVDPFEPVGLEPAFAGSLGEFEAKDRIEYRKPAKRFAEANDVCLPAILLRPLVQPGKGPVCGPEDRWVNLPTASGLWNCLARQRLQKPRCQAKDYAFGFLDRLSLLSLQPRRRTKCPA